MPHFGLMDATKMREDEAVLLRARLHIRGGRRRLRQGKDAAALAALYDALLHAMRWYALSPKNQMKLGIADPTGLRNERAVFLRLSRAGVLESISDFDALTSIVAKAIDDPSFRFDAQGGSAKIDRWMTQLGVMPFDEGSLPPEDPATP